LGTRHNTLFAVYARSARTWQTRGGSSMGELLPANITESDLAAWIQERSGKRRLQADTMRMYVSVLQALDRDGVPGTDRHIFYVVEGWGVVPKTEQAYKQVCYHVLQMRRKNILRYEHIADYTRWIRRAQTFTGLEAFMEYGQQAYRRSLWANQAAYVQVWCEKDAIAGILRDVTGRWDVPLFVVRGYSSETFAFESAEDIKRQSKPTYIYYFGDWDPSGVGISKDIEKKMRGFGASFTFERVGITEKQIYEWQLPTRPAKPKDSRAKNGAARVSRLTRYLPTS
jgi:hypothetical protein